MNICVCGYYGMGNFGDELFLKTFRQIFVDEIVFQWTPYIDINKIDAVIVGGGDLILPYSFNESNFPKILENHPTWIYGVGIVDYYEHSTWSIIEIEKNRERISKAVKASFRDKNSVSLAKELQFNKNIELVPDIVYGYKEPKFPIVKFSSNQTIGICTYVYDDFPLEKMQLVFNELATKGYHLVFIPVVNKNNFYTDMEMCRTLRDMVIKSVPSAKTTLLGPEYDLEMTYSYIQAVDYLISFKLHPTLVALRKGIPTFSFSKLTKVSTLYQMLGMDYFISNFDLSFEDILQRIESFLKESKAKYSTVSNLISSLEHESLVGLTKLKEEIKNTVI